MVQVSDQLKRFVNRTRIDCSATENVPDPPPNDPIWTPALYLWRVSRNITAFFEG